MSADELLRAVGQLETGELDDFVRDVLALRARRQAKSLSQEETVLLQRTNEGFPPEVLRRYQELIARRQARLLTPEELEELIALTDRAERLEADRAAALAELAQVRGVSLDDLMRELGIRPAPNPHG